MSDDQSPPVRIFNPDLPILDHKNHAPDRPETEDKTLSTFLEEAVADVLSKHPKPIPPCPRCGGHDTCLQQLAGVRRPLVPLFRCHYCQRSFRRSTGTPLANLRLHHVYKLIPMLSRQQPYRSAARILGVKYVTIVRHARRFQAWLLQLDPSGYWESKIRLGLVPKPDIPCIYCGQYGSVHYRGFWTTIHEETRRYCWCDACNRTFSAESGGIVVSGGAVITGHLTAPYRRRFKKPGEHSEQDQS